MIPTLQARWSGGGVVRFIDEKEQWRLEIPNGPQGIYRWAQLDDYQHLHRSAFLWSPVGDSQTLCLSLRARVSATDLPGTWGFGLWNDPFSLGLGLGGMRLRLPTLPNAAWFFYAGPNNYLALHDTHPALGLLAATFSAPCIPSLLLALGGFALPMLVARPFARVLRRWIGRFVAESGALLDIDPVQWHAYRMEWLTGQVAFYVDGVKVFMTDISPRAPLGLVLWIDNQYAAFRPSGQVKIGMSENREPAWLDLAGIEVLR
jgi:hypothetical protein